MLLHARAYWVHEPVGFTVFLADELSTLVGRFLRLFAHCLLVALQSPDNVAMLNAYSPALVAGMATWSRCGQVPIDHECVFRAPARACVCVRAIKVSEAV